MVTRGRFRLLVLGDSIAYGTGARLLEDTIGNRLVRSLEREGYDASLDVLAVPGATTRDLAAQVRRAASLGVDLALIVVGANDLTRLIPPAQSAAALGTAVTALRAANVRVVVVPAPDLSDLPFVPPVARPWVHRSGSGTGAGDHSSECVQGAGNQTVVRPLPALLAIEQAGVDEDLQVMGDGRLGECDRIGQLTHTSFGVVLRGDQRHQP